MMVKTEEIIKNVRKEGRTWLTEIEAKQVLANAGIDVVPTELASNSAEAVRISLHSHCNSTGVFCALYPPGSGSRNTSSHPLCPTN